MKADRMGCVLSCKMEYNSRPYMAPLYWKCMWSMIRNPGESNIPTATKGAEGILNSLDSLDYQLAWSDQLVVLSLPFQREIKY